MCRRVYSSRITLRGIRPEHIKWIDKVYVSTMCTPSRNARRTRPLSQWLCVWMDGLSPNLFGRLRKLLHVTGVNRSTHIGFSLFSP